MNQRTGIKTLLSFQTTVLLICSACNFQLADPLHQALQKDEATKSEEPGSQGMPLPGGYSQGDINSTEVKSAAAFALAKIIEKAPKSNLQLQSIESVKQQVVAGMNYAMVLRLTAEKKVLRYRVVVSVPLGNEAMELTEQQQL